MLRLVRAGAFLGFLGFVGLPTEARAYCRSTTGKAAATCPAPCAETGTPLYWAKPNLNYAFNVRPLEGMESADVRRIFGASFATWTDVTCPHGSDGTEVPIGLSARAKAGTTTDAVGPEYEEPNDNAMVFFSGDEWVRAGYDARAFALTSLWFRAENSRSVGEIVGADIYFNGAMNFTECPDTGCPESWGKADLQNVATHEVGHFLGLAHTDTDPAASMWCDARAGQVNKRQLSDDDIEGLCAIYPPGTFSAQKSDDDGCSVRAAGFGAGSAWAPFAALVLLFGARRRRLRVGR